MNALRFFLISLVGITPFISYSASAEDPERHAAEVLRKARDLQRLEKEDEAADLIAAVTKEFEAGVIAHPREAVLWLGLARLQDHVNNKEGTTKSIETALRLAPNNARVLSFHGWRLGREKKVVEAEEQFKRAIELASKDGDIRLEYAVCLLAMNRTTDAEVQAGEAVKLNAMNAEATAVWSVLLFNRGKEAEAIGTLQAAVELNPQSLQLRDGLATFLGMSRRPEEAYAQRMEIRRQNRDWTENEAKLIVLAAQMRNSKLVESHISRLRELNRARKEPLESFCRDDFFVRGRRVVVEEHFEAKGDVEYKYVFHVHDVRGQPAYEVFLAAIPAVTDQLRKEGKIRPEQCVFVIGKWHNDDGEQYGIYPTLPTYEQARAVAVEIMEGKRQPSMLKEMGGQVPSTVSK